jgi:hypothetical protein
MLLVEIRRRHGAAAGRGKAPEEVDPRSGGPEGAGVNRWTWRHVGGRTGEPTDDELRHVVEF